MFIAPRLLIAQLPPLQSQCSAVTMHLAKFACPCFVYLPPLVFLWPKYRHCSHSAQLSPCTLQILPVHALSTSRPSSYYRPIIAIAITVLSCHHGPCKVCVSSKATFNKAKRGKNASTVLPPCRRHLPSMTSKHLPSQCVWNGRWTWSVPRVSLLACRCPEPLSIGHARLVPRLLLVPRPSPVFHLPSSLTTWDSYLQIYVLAVMLSHANSIHSMCYLMGNSR